ncbi:tRNA-uridine aminocarboxypropyltransferase [Edwardsiella tarda]|uniref:tRNA-uridine aminocarboxypropyltransferase n=1 Tax=Edwardsiella tarda TaxID=636 RepID=UPI003A8769DC
MSPNAVLRLRAERLCQSTRPFHARGCRVQRCQRCLLPEIHCLCATLATYPARSRFCLMMYDTEPLKPSNTGRLIADVLPDTLAYGWSRTQPDPALLTLLADPAYQPYVIFPGSYAEPQRVVTQVTAEAGRRPLFIMLDGTWPEARKMFRKSPYLDGFPVLSINMAQAPGYLLREAQRPEQYCTAEVATALLALADDADAAQGLLQHFTHFRRQYLLGKSHPPTGNTAQAE